MASGLTSPTTPTSTRLLKSKLPLYVRPLSHSTTAGANRTRHRVLSDYPSLDCVFLNSGVQSATRLSRPLEFDLAKFHQEVNVNFTSIVNLMIKFLPHLQSKPYPTGLIVTGTHLALVPAATMAAYSASKAALTAFVDCCRAQNRQKSTKIIEIYPPVVQSKTENLDPPHTLGNSRAMAEYG